MATHTLATDIAHNLRAAADWLDAHPDIKPNGVDAGEYGARINVRAASDADAETYLRLIDPVRLWDYRYDEGHWTRILGGQVNYIGVELSVAVAR